jgi:hypothetical protein
MTSKETEIQNYTFFWKFTFYKKKMDWKITGLIQGCDPLRGQQPWENCLVNC